MGSKWSGTFPFPFVHCSDCITHLANKWLLQNHAKSPLCPVKYLANRHEIADFFIVCTNILIVQLVVEAAAETNNNLGLLKMVEKLLVWWRGNNIILATATL